MLDEAAKPEAPFKEILVWKFSRFTRKREHAVAFKAMLRQARHPRGLHHRARRRHPHRQAAWRPSSRAWTSSTAENLAQEVTRGMREAASRGFWVTSYAPYGYNRVMVPGRTQEAPHAGA